jgi:hypothetical protein
MLAPTVDSQGNPSLCRAMVNNLELGSSATYARRCRTSESGSDRGGRTQVDSVAGEHGRMPNLALIQSYRLILATPRRRSIDSLCRDALIDLEGDLIGIRCRVRGSRELSKRSREYMLQPSR